MGYNHTLACLLLSLTWCQVWSMSSNQNKSKPHPPAESFSSRAIHSRLKDGSPFASWSIWDRPGDQLALEQGSGGKDNTRDKPRRRPKQVNNGTQNSLTIPMTSGNNDPQERQGCQGNVQVGFYPVILVLIAAAAGLITIAIVWAIGRKWSDIGTTSSGHGYGSDSGSSGWGREMNDSGFGRVLRNLDLNQLTTLVTSGIEAYRKIAEKS